MPYRDKKKYKIEEVKEIILSSPLKEEEKQELLDLFSRDGASDDFFNLFNTKLIANFEERKNIYGVGMKNLEEGFEGVDRMIEEKGLALEKLLVEKLSGISPADTDGQKKVFDIYYEDLLNTLQEKENLLKDIVGNALFTAIKS